MKLYCISLILLVAVGYAFGVNIALNADTQQSSTLRGIYTSDRAVDGDTGKMFFHDTCTHTNCHDKDPHWTVCLGNMTSISSVTIHNPDYARGRLRNIRIDVFQTNPSQPGAVAMPCGSVTSTPVTDGTEMTFTCPSNTVGRYIRISKTTMEKSQRGWHQHHQYMCDALLLCEVEVTGKPSITCPTGFMMNRGSCYHFSTVGVNSWFEARDACQAMGADLVVINDQMENNFIEMQLAGLPGNMDYFAGLHKLNDGVTWMWIDPNAMMGVSVGGNNNGMAFSDWRGNQGLNPNQRCMRLQFVNMQMGYSWFNVDCTPGMRTQYICEISPTYPMQPRQKCF
ncbi:C-type lectin domain family 4 member C-like [Gigantopelta aegis]|uniref:C-type lectin domain family 4 member C-like n=1 Tax=Gigantopelta aegis TaxID=1735272 RepID=UPI001B88B8F6|nr:C-type lectin domain family 4 member C-like [Gigantopelta aegis]